MAVRKSDHGGLRAEISCEPYTDDPGSPPPPIPDRSLKKPRPAVGVPSLNREPPVPVSLRQHLNRVDNDRSSFLSPFDIPLKSAASSCDSQRSTTSRGSRATPDSTSRNSSSLTGHLHSRPASIIPAVDENDSAVDTDGDDVWVLSNGSLGPPIPPRQPLRRSVSLTHRSPPFPRHPAVAEPPPPLPPSRTAAVRGSLTRSAPQLVADQVVPMSSWPLHDRSINRLAFRSPTNVVPLTHWPLPDTSGRLLMDSLVRVSHASNVNEYVEAPFSDRATARLAQKPSTSENRLTNTHLTIAQSEPAELTVPLGTTPVATIALDMSHSRVKQNTGRGLLKKLTLCCRRSRTKSNSDEEVCRSRTPCLRCGRCQCSDCTTVRVMCCLSDKQCSTAVDVVSCMCCVKPIFYHCLKDDNGEEDCSEKPCSCTSGPHCCKRWTIMALLLPCLPCLCLYPPLGCALRSSRAERRPPVGCQCSRAVNNNANKSVHHTSSTKRLLNNGTTV